jgi:hypothetical protein
MSAEQVVTCLRLLLQFSHGEIEENYEHRKLNSSPCEKKSRVVSTLPEPTVLSYFCLCSNFNSHSHSLPNIVGLNYEPI